MADLSDVLDALADLTASTLYPPGQNGPLSAAGLPVVIYPGWPAPDALKHDLAAGSAHVSLFAPDGMEKNTTRYPGDWQEMSRAAITLSGVFSGNALTLAGSVTAGQVVAVLFNNQAFPYAAQAGDTLASLCTALAAQIDGATASGNTLTLPDSARDPLVRFGTTGTSQKEVRRQERLFQMSVWAATPQARDAIARLLDPVFSDTPRLTLADGSGARLIYHDSRQIDSVQAEGVYRRDLRYTVEYATTRSETDTTITQQGLTVSQFDVTLINTLS